VGGYEGLFDMSGNVEEWEDSCDPGGSPDGSPAWDYCMARGGQFGDGDQWVGCDGLPNRMRNEQFSAIGIRCCWPPN
jgi:hypothetical protein